MAEPMPQPPTHLFGLLGNTPDIDPNRSTDSFTRLAKVYGPIYRLDVAGQPTVLVSSQKTVHEVCNEDRFEKLVSGPLAQLRPFIKDGLFTAHSKEENWHLAHKLLMPLFGPIAIRKMFPKMLDIASQMILKWDRYGGDHEIDLTDDTTRLTFDTIGLCAFNHRFNDFYAEAMHPFAKWMTEVLLEASKRSARLKWETSARIWSAEKFNQNVVDMHKLCDDIIAERKRHPRPDVDDLLNAMLTGQDPETGARLSDENIRYQMATFLVAGHETTSGTLSFLIYCLLKTPEKLHKVQQEVDSIVRDETLKLEHIAKLTYLDACIKEALRLHPPLQAFNVHAKTVTMLAGKYQVSPQERIAVLVPPLHRDPEVWGTDVEVFRPERMLNGGFEKLPPDSWKPFGNGMRACIGRVFAWQEMMSIMALILQRFTLQMADPFYELRYHFRGTVKPEGFNIKVTRRPGKGDWVGLFGGELNDYTAKPHTEPVDLSKSNVLPHFTVLYGSNAGTCKAFAEDLQSSGVSNGFNVHVKSLDSVVEHVPKDQLVVVIAPSYEGQPADNAKVFHSWLETHQKDAHLLEGVKYSVFGVGNSDWANTFHRIPKLINEYMSKMGAVQFHAMGVADAKKDLFGEWENWTSSMWASARSLTGSTQQKDEPRMVVDVWSPRSTKVLGGQDLSIGTVRKSIQLVGTEVGTAKRHMEIEMPEDNYYQSGDYLVVLPANSMDNIRRVITRFDLAPDDMLQVSGTSKAYLPSQEPQSLYSFFATAVELNTPITKLQLRRLAAATSDEDQRLKLEALAEDPDYQHDILRNRFSIIDVLEDFPKCTIPLAEYIDMLKPLAPRQYSISSSPLALQSMNGLPNLVSISYDVYSAPALSGRGRRFDGVASTYLARQHVGAKIRCFIRRTNIPFHLPADPMVPIIMIAAGTGLAPMRGFLQERAALHELAGKKLGPALLYFGCRDEDKDFIYKDELYLWERKGIVQVRPTFSRAAAGDGGAHKYISERVWAEREEIRLLFRGGAKIFLCGSADKVGKSVKDTFTKIYQESHDCGEEEARVWLQKQSEDRFVSDLFS